MIPAARRHAQAREARGGAEAQRHGEVGMNVGGANVQEIDGALWERPRMREALAVRDMATVYRSLQRIGVSQRRIAALTAQSQSEISEILKGRQVMAYEVLARIADGLGIPRGYMGLAYDDSGATTRTGGGDGGGTGGDAGGGGEGAGGAGGGDGREAGDGTGRGDDPAALDEQVRRLLAHAAQVTIGAAAGDAGGWGEPLPRTETPVPHRIGMADVEQVESVTRALRALDYRYGGGVCRDAVVAQLAWSQRLLGASCPESVTLRLHRALADQHNLAGWTSFDAGLYGSATGHLARALEQAKYARSSSLAANVLYRMGRVHLHRARILDALRFFQLGQICAQDAGCERTVAMLFANEAWAYALLGDAELALKSISRAGDELARAHDRDSPAWVSFFGSADLDATTGMVHADLAQTHPEGHRDGHLGVAEGFLTRALGGRDPDMARSRAFELTALATVRLRAGDMTAGVANGHEAVALATRIRSARIADRLAPLQAVAMMRPHGDAQDLARRISAVRAA
ncbi:helix-turn-helix transcriptional regulator [Streptosporangium sp. NPDC023615]|uniref:helix-turn-helix domain-containing protein n=1 Tax=Streptosporangium sp. NPDC023615 TaxID=3154794 RepID=UPI00341E71B2